MQTKTMDAYIRVSQVGGRDKKNGGAAGEDSS
jgi:hypothetical protein